MLALVADYRKAHARGGGNVLYYLLDNSYNVVTLDYFYEKIELKFWL